MYSRLNQIEDWLELAKQCDYKASKIARCVGISTRQLSRRAQKLFGRSAHAWLNDQKLLTAPPLLKQSVSIKWVARELGFKQESHFSRKFKQRFGCSPKNYLIAWRTGIEQVRPKPTFEHAVDIVASDQINGIVNSQPKKCH